MVEREERTDVHRWWQQDEDAGNHARRAYERRNSQEFGRGAAMALLRPLRMEKNTTIVDIGCGDGELLRFLANAGCANRYIGIDPNAEGTATDDISFLAGSAETAPDIIACLEGDVFVVATLTIGLWHQPERLLQQLLADHVQVKDVFIADIVRPTTERAWSMWRSFAHSDEERRYLDDHASVLLTVPRWARFISDVRAEWPDISLAVETFDIRTPGIGGRTWHARDMDAFPEDLSAMPVPQGIFVHASRRGCLPVSSTHEKASGAVRTPRSTAADPEEWGAQ